MEPHKKLSDGIDLYRPVLEAGYEAYFRKALAFARAYYAEEMEQIGSVKSDSVDPHFFFREYIWVVHATGFSAKAVGKFMPRLVDAYGSYDQLAERTVQQAEERVKPVCNNPQKIRAIHTASILIRDGIRAYGWEKYRKEKLSSPALLAKLPYVGPVTSFHLGRNIGLLDCVKPDLHLVRLAELWGFKDCVEMCKSMQEIEPSLPLGIVDLVVWYAASTFGTIEAKKVGSR